MDFQHIEATFGKLEHRSLSFSKGLNIIEAPNESGKSTLLAFLRVMLYGFPPRERGALADKNRYAPWSLSPMRGTLALTCQKGDITLQRDTARANSPMGRFSAVYTGSSETVDGLTAADEEVAHMLRRSHKPIILAVNKCDKVGEAPMELYEFYNLGFDEVLPISSVHGHGTGDLLDAVCAHLDFSETVVEEDRIPVAIIGRPNVGKSSLTNRILGENRMIVANEAGTTRDAIDTPVDNAYGKFIFTDTAGLRKRSNITDGLERYMVVRALAAVERSRVALILVDATVGFTEQDSKVAGYAHEQGKACIIVVNKWDLVEKDGKTMDRMREDIRRDLSYMPYAPIVFISAMTGQRVSRLFELINYVREQASMRITTGMLNSVLADAQTRVQPPTDKGRRLKIYYMTQVGIKPPHFVVFCNDKKLFHFSYRRYLENQIRSVFGLEGTPIIMTIRQKGEDENA